MNYTEFKNGLEEGKFFPIYLFEGEDSFFRERGLVLLKNKYLQEPDLNYATFSGEKLNENELISSLTAFPFMSQKRITLLREYYPKSNVISAELKRYFENPISDSIFIIINEKPSDTIKKLSNVCVVDCKKADASIISRYVKGKCAQAGIIIDLENAKTHDKLWNATQNQLKKEGIIHGYLRMYWVKKILEWTIHPEDALEVAIYLNDKYAYDSPSANGYVGILWGIGGLHDRAFIDYPIFGKIRRMSYSSLRKKFELSNYIEKY